MSSVEVRDEALRLEARERAALARELINSLDPVEERTPADEIDRAHAELASDRLRAFRAAGSVGAVDSPELIRQIRGGRKS